MKADFPVAVLLRLWLCLMPGAGFIVSALAQPASEQWQITAVTDGDSLKSGNIRLRLHGIDAPEIAQTCKDASGDNYSCGLQARDYLYGLISPPVSLYCQHLDTDRYRRLIVRCFDRNGRDINAMMVSSGWARAYYHYADDYLPAEQDAKVRRTGIWQGWHQPPWQWRQQKRQ